MMSSPQPPAHLQLDRLIVYPREDLDAEYKSWLDLTVEEDRATLAKASIALANHGGGFVVLGFEEANGTFQSTPRDSNTPQITQDAVNESVRRYAEPEFHCQVYDIAHPDSSNVHTVIAVPGGEVPVMSKRDRQEVGVLQHRFYIRKPGPRSEEPHTSEEWRRLMDRCIRAKREDLLDAVRSIIVGQPEAQVIPPDPLETLSNYCTDSHARWSHLSTDLPHDSPARFLLGFYEMGFALVGATPASGLAELRRRLAVAQSIAYSGWPPFLEMDAEWAPYPYDGFIEAWIGRPTAHRSWNHPSHADYWRASVDGMLYTIRGYIEDGELAQQRQRPPGTEFTNSIPCMRIAEGLLFAIRLAAEYEEVEKIEVWCRFTGLEGRSLLLVDHPPPFVDVGHATHDPEVTLTGQVSIQHAHDNLPEVIHGLVKPLYEPFGFYEIPIWHVQSMLMKMRQFR